MQAVKNNTRQILSVQVKSAKGEPAKHEDLLPGEEKNLNLTETPQNKGLIFAKAITVSETSKPKSQLAQPINTPVTAPTSGS